MVIIPADLPNLHYKYQGKVSAKTGLTKISYFANQSVRKVLTNKIKMQAESIVAIEAEYKYNANAIVSAKYQLHAKGNQYYATLVGKAIKTSQLENKKTALDNHLRKIGLTGYTTAPVTAQLDNRVNKLFNDKTLLDSYPILRKAIKAPNFNKKSIFDKLTDILTNDNTFLKNNIITYGHRDIAREVVQDVYGLGIVGRLLNVYPHLYKIECVAGRLTYTINDKTFVYGDKHNEDSKAITSQYINHLVHILSFNSISNIAPKFNGMFGLLKISIEPIAAGHHKISIVNTALRRIINKYPSTSEIALDGNNIVGNYDFEKPGNLPVRHKTFKISNDDKYRQSLNSELLIEIKQLCTGKSNYNYTNTLGNKTITYSRYVGWKVIIVNDMSSSLVTLQRKINISRVNQKAASKSNVSMTRNNQNNSNNSVVNKQVSNK